MSTPKQFDKRLHIDKGSKPTTAFPQERSGGVEWLQPTIQYERKVGTDLYFPPGVLGEHEVARPRLDVSGINMDIGELHVTDLNAPRLQEQFDEWLDNRTSSALDGTGNPVLRVTEAFVKAYIQAEDKFKVTDSLVKAVLDEIKTLITTLNTNVSKEVTLGNVKTSVDTGNTTASNSLVKLGEIKEELELLRAIDFALEETMGNKLEDIKTKIDTTNTSVAKELTLGNVRTELQTANTTLTNSKTVLDGIKAVLDLINAIDFAKDANLTTSITNIRADLDALNTKLATETTLNAVKVATEGINAKDFAKEATMAQKFEDVKTKIDTTNTTLAKDSTLGTVKVSIDTGNTTLSESKAVLDNIKAGIDVLNDKDFATEDGIVAELETVQAKLDTLDTNLAKELTLGNVKTSIDAGNTTLSESKTVLDNIKAVLDLINAIDFAKDANIGTKLDNNKATLDSINVGVAKDSTLTDVRGSIDSGNTTLSQIQILTNDLKTLLTSLDGKAFATDANLTAKTEELKTKLDSLIAKDYSTETTLTSAKTVLDELKTNSNTLNGKDFATQATLADILAKIIAAPATEAKQDAGNTSLTTIAGKDFATQATLAEILAKIIVAPATEAKQDESKVVLDNIKTALDALNTKDFSTEAKLEAVRLILAGVTEKQDTTNEKLTVLAWTLATEETLEKVRVLLEEINDESDELNEKDFATETTLNAKLEELRVLLNTINTVVAKDTNVTNTNTVLSASKITQDNIKTVLDDVKTVLDNLNSNGSRIRGYDGANWVPVKTTGDGKLVLDGEVSVNAEGMTVDLGEAELTQGASGVDPWLVRDVNRIKTAPSTGSKNIGASATEIFAGSSRKENRYLMSIYNTSNNTVFWSGGSGVTVNNGFPLLPGDSIKLEFDRTVATPIYMVASATSSVRVVELS